MSASLEHALVAVLLALAEFLTWQRLRQVERRLDRTQGGPPGAVERRHGERRQSSMPAQPPQA